MRIEKEAKMGMDGTFEKRLDRSGKQDFGKGSGSQFVFVPDDIYFLSEGGRKVKVKGNDVGDLA